MNATTLLETLNAAGVDLWIKDGNLLGYRCPPGSLSPELRDLVTRHRAGLVRQLTPKPVPKRAAPRKRVTRKPDPCPAPGVAIYHNPLPVHLISEPHQLRALVPLLMNLPRVALDVETFGPGKDALNPRRGRVRCIQLGTPAAVYIVDCLRITPRPLAPLFGARGPVLVGQNISFDVRFLRHAYGFAMPSRYLDTMIAAQVLEAGSYTLGRTRDGRPKEIPFSYSLEALVGRHLKLWTDKRHQQADWNVPELVDGLRDYAAADVVLLPMLADTLTAKLAREGLLPILELEMAVLPPAIHAEESGLLVDGDRWLAVAAANEQRRDAARAELDAILGAPFAWNSPTQRGRLPRNRLGDAVPQDWPARVARQLADGQAPKEVLAFLEDLDLLAEPLRRFVKAAKGVSSFGASYLDTHRDRQDGRLHPTFRTCWTVTGRFSCADPNLQQLPHAAEYRSCFIAAPGCVLVKLDYSQLELRLAAEVSNDHAMLTAYQQPGSDLHQATADRLGCDRALAKTLNFGLVYGSGSETFRTVALADYGLRFDAVTAARLRQEFFAIYPGLRSWQRSVPDGELETLTILGRKRRMVSGFNDKLNAGIQGSGGDAIKQALRLWWERRHRVPSARLVNVIHDELLFEVPVEDAPALVELAERCMVDGLQPCMPRVPAVVEAQVGPTWGGR